jgi:hypothetical protein
MNEVESYTSELFNMKRTLTLLTAVTLCAAGCTSTMTLGSKANESDIVGGKISTSEIEVTLPLVKAEVKTISSPTDKKKKK